MQNEAEAPKAFVTELLSRLLEIGPDQLRRPLTPENIPDDWKLLGVARNFTRQAFTLVEMIEEESKPVASELEKLLLEDSQNRRGMNSGGYRPNRARDDRIAYLRQEMHKQERSAELVLGMMWAEIQDQFPDANTGHLNIAGPAFKIYASPCNCEKPTAIVIGLGFDDKTKKTLH